MADQALKDMLTALTGKIKSLSGGSATAEDTALMGFAVEKIAGQVSVLELQLLADDLKAALSTLAQTKTTAFDTKSNGVIQAIEDLHDARDTQFLNLANTQETTFNSNAATKTTSFNDNATSKTTGFNDNASTKTTAFNNNATAQTSAIKTTGAEQVAKVVSASGAALATPVLTDGAITYNKAGLVTRWVSETGKTYSEIVYDARKRITSWLETYTNAQNATVSYRYAAIYDGTSLRLKTLSRTLVA